MSRSVTTTTTAFSTPTPPPASTTPTLSTLPSARGGVTLTPSTLFFAPTRSTVGVIAKITLQNAHDAGAVGFKIKTNAPARYSVKPVLGVLLPGAVVHVLVRSEAPIQPDHDRFLLQTIPLSDEEAQRMDPAKWRTLDRSRMADTFISCKASPTRPRTLSSSSSYTSSTGSPPRTTSGIAASSAPAASHRPLSKSKSKPNPARPSSSPPPPPATTSQIRVTKLDLLVFSFVCLVLGGIMPYSASFLHLLSLRSI
ncbi:hypothetical protein PhCBS80983_g04931 [Powellomyces hirtus]|uniref:MSP domain-containing protein n=1 Tax=Powellomyces hirtus TaxID=109895 RepID=A0A507DWM7_9FUNG|nr:hypothetical protein PhCBS80983_g04931 [Powellomyces hirtus]